MEKVLYQNMMLNILAVSGFCWGQLQCVVMCLFLFFCHFYGIYACRFVPWPHFNDSSRKDWEWKGAEVCNTEEWMNKTNNPKIRADSILGGNCWSSAQRMTQRHFIFKLNFCDCCQNTTYEARRSRWNNSQIPLKENVFLKKLSASMFRQAAAVFASFWTHTAKPWASLLICRADNCSKLTFWPFRDGFVWIQTRNICPCCWGLTAKCTSQVLGVNGRNVAVADGTFSMRRT